MRVNAFVDSLGASGFRCRRPFRRVLQEDLAVRHPELVRRLHAEAARWYTDRGRYIDALRHAVTISDWPAAAALAITRLGVAWLLTAPEAEHVRSLLEHLPDAETGAEPELLRATLALAAVDPRCHSCTL